jgi:uncharacterized membrane protein YgcG
MAREWAVLLETLSPKAARSLGKSLAAEGLDVDVAAPSARVWCYAPDKSWALEVAGRVLALEQNGGQPLLQGAPRVLVWDDERHLYVDPDHPEESPLTRAVRIDSDVMPHEVRWRVRLTLESVFDFRRVRRELPELRRPVISTGTRHLDLGARDRSDADAIAAAASHLVGVAKVDVSEIDGRICRWLLRQRLAGNYAADYGPGYNVSIGDSGGGHSGGGGDGGGHGGGGHGGH